MCNNKKALRNRYTFLLLYSIIRKKQKTNRLDTFCRSFHLYFPQRQIYSDLFAPNSTVADNSFWEPKRLSLSHTLSPRQPPSRKQNTTTVTLLIHIYLCTVGACKCECASCMRALESRQSGTGRSDVSRIVQMTENRQERGTQVSKATSSRESGSTGDFCFYAPLVIA